MNKYSMIVNGMSRALDEVSQEHNFTLSKEEKIAAITKFVGLIHVDDLQSVCDKPVSRLILAIGEEPAEEIGYEGQEIEDEVVHNENNDALIQAHETTNGYQIAITADRANFQTHVEVKNVRGDIVYRRDLSSESLAANELGRVLDAMDIQRVTQIHQMAKQEEEEYSRENGQQNALQMLAGAPMQNNPRGMKAQAALGVKRAAGVVGRLFSTKGVNVGTAEKVDAMVKISGGSIRYMAAAMGIELGDYFTPAMENLREVNDLDRENENHPTQHLFFIDGSVLHATRDEAGAVQKFSLYGPRGDKVIAVDDVSTLDFRSCVAALAGGARQSMEATVQRIQESITQQMELEGGAGFEGRALALNNETVDLDTMTDEQVGAQVEAEAEAESVYQNMIADLMSGFQSEANDLKPEQAANEQGNEKPNSEGISGEEGLTNSDNTLGQKPPEPEKRQRRQGPPRFNY